MRSPSEKGDALEAAVAAIERHILGTSPRLSEKTFLIESKKRIFVNGVHHEIDIFVTIDPGGGYKSVFIFECKNWEDAVNKNEIVIFAEKVAAAQAQRGFFVAKSFTKDADAAEKELLDFIDIIAGREGFAPGSKQYLNKILKRLRLAANKEGASKAEGAR